MTTAKEQIKALWQSKQKWRMVSTNTIERVQWL
jgi:hypothetical protein